MKHAWLIILCGILLCLGSFSAGYVYHWYEYRSVNRVAISQELQSQTEAKALPAPVFVTSTPEKIMASSTVPAVMAAPVAFSLPVPFISQAPTKNWDANHEEYCEEAALLMVVSYKTHTTYSIADQEAALAEIKSWEMQNLGHFENTSVAEVVRIAKEKFGLQKVRIVESPTADQIATFVSAGHLVLVPANGQLLENPFFKNGGPTYHMVLVRGVTADGNFVVNDPGTQNGDSYVYARATLMNAMHDWDHGADASLPASGPQRIIVIE